MNKKKRKLEDRDDEEWNPKGKTPVSKKKKYADESCFIHCTNSSETLVKLPTLESWKKPLKAAKVRENDKVLELATITERKR